MDADFSGSAAGHVAALRDAGFTVAQIAEQVGVDLGTVYRWARGWRPDPYNYARLTAMTAKLEGRPT